MNTARKRSRRNPAVAVAAVGLVAAGIGVAQAQVAGEDVISACFKSSDGMLRVIDAGGRCRANETLLQWNKQGLAGPQGVPGEPGIQGPAGAPGDPGHSAYQVWLDQDGNTGSEQDFLDSLRVQWSNILGNPLGIDDGAPDQSGDPVSWSKITDLTTGTGDGAITGEFLKDSSVTREDIAPDVLRTKNLSGFSVTTVSVDISVPPAATGRFALAVPGIDFFDFLAVSPPADLPAGLAFSGAAITAPGVVTVSLSSVNGAAVTQNGLFFTVNWIDLTD